MPVLELFSESFNNRDVGWLSEPQKVTHAKHFRYHRAAGSCPRANVRRRRSAQQADQTDGSSPKPRPAHGWYQFPMTASAPPSWLSCMAVNRQQPPMIMLGWSRLAEDYGFAVLFPEQTRQNNANLCFNWFQTDDVTRDKGEVMSIRQMISSMIDLHGIDRGVSTSPASLRAAPWPMPFWFLSDLCGGAIIAGLPFGVASTVRRFDRMRGHGIPASTTLDAKLRETLCAPGTVADGLCLARDDRQHGFGCKRPCDHRSMAGRPRGRR